MEKESIIDSELDSESDVEYEYKHCKCHYLHKTLDEDGQRIVCSKNATYGNCFCYPHKLKVERKDARVKLFHQTMKEAEEIFNKGIYLYENDKFKEQLGKCKTATEIINYMHWK
jgi:hypothetical protein